MPNLIQRVSNISYGEFRTRHLVTNQPVIVGEELIETWSCLQHWRVANSAPASKAVASNGLPEENTSFSTCSMPNLAYMRIKYGENTVPVDEDGCRSQKALREVIDIWEQEYQSVHETNVAKMYVKDWHLALQLGTSSEEEPFYTTPGIFADDWMNNYYRKYTNDDFRFVYMGPAGTFTRLHRDVYTSYSWSTNVVGRKRWWLFPPTVTSYITRPNGETIADDLSAEASFDLQGIDAAIWPNWHIAKDAMYVVEQEEGETIFVPSGWYHQVLNLTFCISINHNWCNSHNLTSMYYSMVDAVNRVERSIDDVKGLLQKRLPADEWEAEWRRVVQELLKQDAGWDWSTFLSMVILGLEESRDLPISEDTSKAHDSSVRSNTDILSDEPSRSECLHPPFPDRRYVSEQVSPLIAHFVASYWGESGEYDGLLSRISSLISQ